MTTRDAGIDLDRPESLRLRHRPVQQRGRVRFEAILAAARHLLMDKGIEGFVVEDVAEYAGIPVGSVYQFFPNKLAIVAEIAAEDTTSLTKDLSAFELDPSADDLQDVVESMIGLVADRWREDPSRSAVWLAMKSTAATRAMAAEQSERMAAALIPALQALGTEQHEDLQLIADVIIELSQSIMLLAYRGDKLNEAVVAELERVIRGYLRAVAQDR
ncbi:MAG: TetR family transcriptional regulator [Actinobacteria bacterium]|nr:TetR family transcriptional regulator [Actinomycetota bacterium]